MVSVGEHYSRELCGGTHLNSTGQIGFLRIVSESSVGSGLRRIEAVTGRGAEAHAQEQLDLLAEAAAALQVPPGELVHKVRELTAQLHQQQREIDQLRREAAARRVDAIVRAPTAEASANALAASVTAVEDIAGVNVVRRLVDADSIERMRQMADLLRERLGSVVVVLGTVIDDKPLLIAAVTPDLVQKGLHAGKLVGQLAKVVGGGGGGRPTMAQAGGRDASKLDKAMKQVPTEVEKQLKLKERNRGKAPADSAEQD
jgi:alanyl-tRNA synthetase